MGDERHSLTDCIRGTETREQARTVMKKICAQEGAEVTADAQVLDMLGLLNALRRPAQKKMWHCLGRICAAIDAEIAKETLED